MIRSRRNLILVFLYSITLIALSLIVGYQVRALWPPADERYSLLREAHRLVVDNYFGDLPAQLDLERGMIRGMVVEIDDPYTVYVEPTAHELQTDNLSGQYGGIGAYLYQDEEGMYYFVPFEDGPAAQAGIIEGDIIVAIDGVEIGPQSLLNDVLALIRGAVGTEVTISLAPRLAGGDRLTITIERQAFPIPSVTSYILPSNQQIGVLVISLFSEKTPQEIEDAHEDLLARGATALILDLRDNAGGLLDSAVATARYFLADGLVLIERRRDNDQVVFRVEEIGKATEIPMVVLVNEATASSAEVVAAAFQGNGRAPLIGRETFGKGSVQVVLELRDGSSLYVTSARWQTPDGRSLDHQGLEPDVQVPTEETDLDPFIKAAVDWFISSQQGMP
ncbi:MAG: PDZ domain-containing protein [Anaerolineales bacterium]|nr:PDZ domain-containing protein [Anaerolineales bacterium]